MDNNEIVREMSLLYELSLAIGTSPLLEENCKHFLTRLLSRKNYDGAVLWLYQKQLDRHHEGEDDLTPAFAFPEVRMPKASETYARKKMLMGDAMLKVCPLGEMENQPFAMPHDSKEGSYAFFCLGELGLMQVYAKGEGRLTALEMNKLRGVVEKFALSVQLCLDRLHYGGS